jgi:hypothetical protein
MLLMPKLPGLGLFSSTAEVSGFPEIKGLLLYIIQNADW